MTSTRRFVLVAFIVLVAVGLLAFQGLKDASVYYLTAQEAVNKRAELGSTRFRMEGTVVPGSVEGGNAANRFSIASGDTVVQVQNKGVPNGVFQEGVPVVLEGVFSKSDDYFISDLVMVKHSEQYKEAHPDRVSVKPSTNN